MLFLQVLFFLVVSSSEGTKQQCAYNPYTCGAVVEMDSQITPHSGVRKLWIEMVQPFELRRNNETKAIMRFDFWLIGSRIAGIQMSTANISAAHCAFQKYSVKNIHMIEDTGHLKIIFSVTRNNYYVIFNRVAIGQPITRTTALDKVLDWYSKHIPDIFKNVKVQDHFYSKLCDYNADGTLVTFP